MTDIIVTPTTKHTLDKYNGFKVPSRSIKSTRWSIYLYNIIKEAEPALLESEPVKIAYNNYVDCVMKYDNDITTWIPSKSFKYCKNRSGIIPSERGYYNNFPNKDILFTYYILYNLIKQPVVNYMEIKYHELKRTKDTEYYNNLIQKLEKSIKKHEDSIADIRRSICKYAELSLKLQEPAVLTKFD